MTAPKAEPRSPKILVIGAGMSGLLMGIRLLEAGIRSFEILEKAAAVGGTWRDNTYPGLACDIPAYLYTYSFEPNPECSHRYARGPEIQAYLERVYDKYGLAPYVRFGQEVTGARYQDGGWLVSTSDGTERRAEIVIAATGLLHHPRYPDIPGLEQFAGSVFHSARWDHSVPLEGRRVGLIGTGSTAVQIVGGVIDRVRSLTVFQRTAQWVLPAADTEYSRLRPFVLRRLRWLALALHYGYSLFYNTLLGSNFAARRRWFFGFFALVAWLHLHTVRNPELRKKLTPNYRMGCKRFVFSDGFYKAIQRPNCALVTNGIERIEARGVRTRDGHLHELDVLVLATGFHARNYMRPMNIVGLDGRTLDAAWADGIRAYRSVALPGFPNFFMLQGPHSPIGNYSLIKISEIQSRYLMQLIERIRRADFASAAPRADVTEAFNHALQADAGTTIWASPGCSSWYLDEQNRLGIWPWTLARFNEDMREPRYEEFELCNRSDG
ncbi:MAG TPA: NAD(P)/FAD-dependent oxidoreductase [Polyangiales bacterium]